MTPTARLAKITAALTSIPSGMGASTGRDAPEWSPGDAYIIAYYESGPESVAVKPAATVECADVTWMLDYIRHQEGYMRLALQIYDAGAMQDAALAKEMAKLLREALAS